VEAIYITALENTRARLIVSESRTTDLCLALLMVADLKARGFIVLRRKESEPQFSRVA
jgi:hypothetical protein